MGLTPSEDLYVCSNAAKCKSGVIDKDVSGCIHKHPHRKWFYCGQVCREHHCIPLEKEAKLIRCKGCGVCMLSTEDEAYCEKCKDIPFERIENLLKKWQ